MLSQFTSRHNKVVAPVLLCSRSFWIRKQATWSRTASSSSSSTTSTTWVRSRVLQRALPNLIQQFDKYKDERNHFPILTPKQTQKAFQPFHENGKNKDAAAAILVPIVSIKEVPSILFTVRSSNIKSHPSQVSFPGGHADCIDNNCLIETALRETQEEIMMESTYPSFHYTDNDPYQEQSKDNHNHHGNNHTNGICIIGKCTSVPSMKGTPVTPVLGVFTYDIPHENVELAFPGYNPNEVEKVFAVSIQELLDNETSENLPRLGSHAPVFYNCAKGGGEKIWGLTAFCLRPILHKILKPIFCQ